MNRLHGLWLAALLVGCGHVGTPTAAGRAPGKVAIREAAAPGLPAPTFGAAEVDVLYDLDTFAAMERLVSSARRSVKLDYYVFGGPTAERLADMLIAKHADGLDVRVLLDGSFGTIPELRGQCLPVFDRLREAGVPVRLHARTPIPPRIGGETIDHNKYFVVDEAEVLLGSMNLAKKFYNFHDLMLHARGPVARDLARQHDFDWYRAGLPAGPVPGELVHAAPGAPPAGDTAQVRVVGTGLGRKTGLEALLPLLAGARRSIHVQMHELGPGPALDALVAARDRGVEVKVLLDPGNVDPFVPLLHNAPKGVVNALALDALLKAGLDVRHYKVGEDFTTAHMKLALVDGEVLFAGSTNWTTGGFTRVAETNLEVRGGRAPLQAEARFQADWSQRSQKAQPPGPVALALCKLYQRLD